MYTELKQKLMSLLISEEYETKIQAAHLIQGLDPETIMDFLDTLFHEFRQMLMEKQGLQEKLVMAHTKGVAAETHQIDTTPFDIPVRWNSD
tara:strand:- start:1256 stop:1528 length:273 start_codon:yes stop_codon:yes gene_type:complete